MLIDTKIGDNDKAPIITIVCNNHSYNNERNRIWNTGGKQFQLGRDMTCYLGDPDGAVLMGTE